MVFIGSFFVNFVIFANSAIKRKKNYQNDYNLLDYAQLESSKFIILYAIYILQCPLRCGYF